jgi:hypothetical protein
MVLRRGARKSATIMFEEEREDKPRIVESKGRSSEYMRVFGIEMPGRQVCKKIKNRNMSVGEERQKAINSRALNVVGMGKKDVEFHGGRGLIKYNDNFRNRHLTHGYGVGNSEMFII